MSYVLTLVADPLRQPLTTAMVDAAYAALATAGARVSEPDWLGPNIACDLPFVGLAPTTADQAVGLVLGSMPVDRAIQPALSRRKRVLVADMDSTIINVECIDELADYVGLKPHIAAITERAMRGELDFATALRERVKLLAGVPERAIEEVWRERVTLNAGARELVQTMRAHGGHAVLVSGGFRQFTRLVRDAVGFDDDRANELIVENGRLAGRVAEPILGAEAKLDALQAICAARGLAPTDAVAVGDGANDAAMVRAAGLGVAYRGKPILKAAARAVIDHADLTALLYLQGYRQTDFRQ